MSNYPILTDMGKLFFGNQRKGKEMNKYSEYNYSPDHTHYITSRVAYLLGVDQQHFWEESSGVKRILYKEIFTELNQIKAARIVRNLCTIRTSVEKNFKRINDAIRFELSFLENLTEYVPVHCFEQLRADGISMSTAKSASGYVIQLNRLIQDRINNCKSLFPAWLKWEYLRNIFIMPGGLTEEGMREAVQRYYANKDHYPYQVFMNWRPVDEGNILLNDYRFVTLLYRQNRDEFVEGYRLQETSESTRRRIDQFLSASKTTAVIVDCENANPFHFHAALCDLEDSLFDRVEKIILYNDVHTTIAWNYIADQLSIPVQHIMTERVLQKKSLLDITLAAGTCREYFQNGTDSFILVSSDSDYWGLISALPEAHFLLMMEREQCSPHMREILAQDKIFYCFLEDFPLDSADDLRERVVYRELRSRLDAAFSMNLDAMLAEILQDVRAGISDDAEKALRNRLAKNLRLEVAGDGTVTIEFNDRK